MEKKKLKRKQTTKSKIIKKNNISPCSSDKLTTFMTPFGRYVFKRLPFGITSAPEIFQQKMTESVSGISFGEDRVN